MLPGWPLVLFLVISCSSGSGNAAVLADTARLSDHLKRFRGFKVYELSAAEYRPIRNEFLSWIDIRIKAGASITQINEELEAANLLPAETDNADDFDKNYVGFLGGVDTVPGAGADDLLAFNVGMFTGGNCNSDETVLLYEKKPLRIIAQFNAELAYTHGYLLRALAVGNDQGARGRLMASAWVASNCTSNWNGNLFRIDLSRGQSSRNILNPGMAAFNAEEMKLGIQNDTVTFDYATMGDTSVLIREGIARYQITDGRAIRRAPIAASFGGFIDEWLTMNDSEAARWATQEASAHHREIAARFHSDIFEWQSAAACPGTPPTREVAIRAEKSKRVTVFRIAGSSASELRMVSVRDALSPECREIDIHDNLSSIVNEPTAR